MTNVNENDLLDKYLIDLSNGNNQALSEIYDLTNKQLYCLCYTYFHNKEDSQDALHDSYLTVKKQIKKFKGKNGFVWIFTITKNICLNKLKIKSKTICIDFDDEKNSTIINQSSTNLEDAYIEKKHNMEIIEDIKKILNKNEFRIIILHIMSDIKFKDIAKITNSLESTVRWQYNNALKKIKKHYNGGLHE